MSYLINTLRTRRIVAVAIVLAAFAQFSMVTHEMLVEHSLGEHCVMCVGQDRLDDGAALVAAVHAITPVFTQLPSIDLPGITFRSAVVSAVRNRGPPIL